MKDITRIHLAKIPYNIEISAKKELEDYLAQLESYTSDGELLQDIEIRMTELLLERNVRQDDVITGADVRAIREQLGEPKEFMTDEATAEVAAVAGVSGNRRKLYRNRDNALIGGVLSGLATYFGINVMWLRLAFIVLSFVSFGFVAVLYGLAWLIIPAANTAAEKLELAGKPVTLASIRELNEAGSSGNAERRERILKRVVTTTVGVFSSLSALFVIMATLLLLGAPPADGNPANIPENYRVAFAFGALAALLLIVLLVLIAFAAFAQKFNTRIWVSGLVIIVLGLSSFGIADGLAAHQQKQEQEQAEIQRNMVTRNITLPEGFTAAKALTVDAPETATIEYSVDENATSITQRTLKNSPTAAITMEGETLRVKIEPGGHLHDIAENTLLISGPQLDSIVVKNGYVSYSGAAQEKLAAEVNNHSSLRLIDTRFDTVTAKVEDSAQFSGEEATIANAKIDLSRSSVVELGNITSLEVTSPQACASDHSALVAVATIADATFVHNGAKTAVKPLQTPCVVIEFDGDDEADLFEYEN